MPRTNLTAAAVERLKTPAVGQVEYYDQRLPGFGLRLSYKGARSWFVMTRVDGKLVRLTLGKYPALPLAHAREEARRAVLMTEAGQDPRRVRNEAEERSRTAKKNTFETAASEFLAKHAEAQLRPSTQREYRRVLTGRDTHAWQPRPIDSITKRDVVEVLEAIDDRGSPGAAKRTLVYLRKFFSWCADRDLIQASPTDRIRAPHPEVKRDRVLSEEELRYVARALQNERTVFGGLIRVLLLTGQRRGEVAGMRWSELELFRLTPVHILRLRSS